MSYCIKYFPYFCSSINSQSMQKLNQFINRYLGILMLLSGIAGLFIDVGDADISLVIILSLGTVIFASYFRIAFTKEIFSSDLRQIPVFYLIRFLALPFVAYFLFDWWSPFYAVSFFLLLLMPSAVSSPAFSAIFGGNVGLALKILVVTSFASIFTIPFLSRWILARDVAIDSQHMFLIMVYTILIPFFLHLPVRRSKQTCSIIKSNGPLITVLGLMTIFLFSTARNRDLIFAEPMKVLIYAGISILFFMLLYLLGFFMMRRQDFDKRVAYSVCSGANNIGIGVTITMLFFPGEINVFFIVAQIAWNFALVPMRYFYKKVQPV
jgi:bile acid:Na+ symporter, BASS family